MAQHAKDDEEHDLTTDESTRIIIVSSDALVRGGIASLLSRRAGLRTVGEARTAKEAEWLGRGLHPDLFVVHTPIVNDEVLEQIHRLAELGRSAPLPVILLTADTADLDLHALQLGSCAILRQDTNSPDLASAISMVTAGYIPMDRRLAMRLATTAKQLTSASDEVAEVLTKRETDVYELVIQGLSNAEIAKILMVAQSTVKSHVQDILAKLGLRNRIQVIVQARRAC
ncbi:LuxR C-terminal-related transcriptional regulator [Streptomyces tsukubensis]